MMEHKKQCLKPPTSYKHQSHQILRFVMVNSLRETQGCTAMLFRGDSFIMFIPIPCGIENEQFETGIRATIMSATAWNHRA